MSRPTTRHQPANVDVQSVGDCGEHHAGNRSTSSPGDDARDRPFGFADLLLDVAESEVSRFADQGDAIRDGLAESGCCLGHRVSVWVAGLGVRHCVERGHVTAGMPAERVCRGSGAHFSRELSDLLKLLEGNE